MNILKLIGFLVALFSFYSPVWATDYSRTVKYQITIQPDGTALIQRTEKVTASALAKIYTEHAKAVLGDKGTKEDFFNELSKEFYLLYGTAPVRDSFEFSTDIDSKGNFISVTNMKAPGFVRPHEKGFRISRKRMEDQGKLSQKLFSKYFEHVIDGHIFESAFLQTSKNSLKTDRITEISLPDETAIETITPVFEEGPIDKWYLDFGGGNVYRGFVKTDKNIVIFEENITTTGEGPTRLIDPKTSADALDELRMFGSFNVVFSGKMGGLSKPESHPFKDDFSGDWSYSVSTGEKLSKSFTYQTLTATAGITVTLTLGASLLWEHHWVCSGWRCSYKLKKFEGKLSFSPTLTPYVEVQASATLSKSWETTIFDRSKPITFWVSCVPVVLYLNAKLDAKASASVSGTMGFRTEANVGVTTSITVKYENGWSKSASASPTYQSPTFTASANISANAEGSLPFTLAAYVYNVAGPFVTFTPWISGEASAGVGSTNQLSYAIKAGMKANGGIQMAGWLKSLCDNIPSVSYEFFNEQKTLKSATYTF